MRAYYPVPVTAENDSDVWYLVDRYRVQARKNRVICMICPWLGGLLFLPLYLLVLLSTLHTYEIQPFADLIGLLPLADPVLEVTHLLIPRLNEGFILDFFFGLGVLCALMALVLFLLELLISVIYHPKKRPMPEGSPKERASSLLANARETMETAARIRPGGWLFFLFLFFLAEFSLLALCILYGGNPAAFFARYFTGSTPLNYLIVFFIGTGVYGMVWGALVLLLWCFRRMKLPYSFVADIECYTIYAGEKAGKLPREELLANRLAKAEIKRKEALDLEKSGAYPKAASLFLEAAHGGDVPAMEHYARHCLISDSRIPAEYWLRRCVSSGGSSKNARRMLRRLRAGLSTGAAFIREETPPTSKKKKG